MSQILFCLAFHPGEDKRGYFLRAEGLAAKSHGGVFTHPALDGQDGILRMGNHLVFRRSADNKPAFGIDAHAGGHDHLAFNRDHLRLAFISQDGYF